MYKDPRSKKRKRKTSKKYKKKTYIKPGMTEAELQQRLVITLVALVGTIVLIIATFLVLGPKIGSLFGLISVHRNEGGKGDTLPPAPPIFASIPKAVNKDKLKITGISEAGATINIYLNGPVKATTTADQEGLFTVTDLKLIKGRNTLFARAIDQTGNESEQTQKYTIIYDTEKPEVTILDPKNGETVENLLKRITVKGEVNEKAKVTVNSRNAIVKPDLTFEITLGVEEGNIDITAIAIDEAGNEEKTSITINYKKD